MQRFQLNSLDVTSFDSPTGLLLRAAAAPYGSSLPSLQEVDWIAFTGLAIEHRVGALALAKFGNALPPEVLKTLHAASLKSAQRNLKLVGELGKVLRILRNAKIAAIPFKGPVTAQLYPDLSQRPFGDLDLFVDPSQVWSARGALLSSSFTPETNVPKHMEADVLRWGCEYNLASHDNTFVVELHWRAAPKSYAMDWEFRTDTPLRSLHISGEEIQVLSAEEDLLVLCMHAAKHVWNTLIWLVDIGLAMQQPLDWQRFHKRSVQNGTHRICAASFELAKLLGYPLPAHAERLFSGPAAKALARELAARIFVERREYFTREDHRLFLRSRERTSDRIAYLWWLGTAPDLYVEKSGIKGRIARFTKVAGGNTAS